MGDRNEEEDIYDMDNEVEEENPSQRQNENPVPFEPIGMDVYAEIEKSQKHVKKIKNQITELDKEYRSRKDPVRSELYLGLKRFLNIYPNDYHTFLEDMSEERYAQFLKPKPGLEKFKAWDKKYKIQRLLRIVELNHGANDRSFLYITIGTINLIHTAKNWNKFEWAAHRLLDEDEEGRGERMKQLTKKEFVRSIKSSLEEEMDRLEKEIITPDRVTVIYVFKKVEQDWVFLAIRKQIVPNGDRGRKSKHEKKGNLKESSQTLNMVIKQGFPHFFVNGTMGEKERIIKTLVESMGYQRSENQKLSGHNIPSLMDTCSRKWTPVSLEAVENSFRADEALKAERGIWWGSRTTELNRQFQMASLRGGSSAGMDEKDPEEGGTEGNPKVKKPAGTEVITFTSSLGKSQIKFKGTVDELDEYLLDAYAQRFITNLTPFINLKKTQSNQAHLEVEE